MLREYCNWKVGKTIHFHASSTYLVEQQSSYKFVELLLQTRLILNENTLKIRGPPCAMTITQNDGISFCRRIMSCDREIIPPHCRQNVCSFCRNICHCICGVSFQNQLPFVLGRSAQTFGRLLGFEFPDCFGHERALLNNLLFDCQFMLLLNLLRANIVIDLPGSGHILEFAVEQSARVRLDQGGSTG